jgi:hypothetical protein
VRQSSDAPMVGAHRFRNIISGGELATMETSMSITVKKITLSNYGRVFRG